MSPPRSEAVPSSPVPRPSPSSLAWHCLPLSLTLLCHSGPPSVSPEDLGCLPRAFAHQFPLLGSVFLPYITC